MNVPFFRSPWQQQDAITQLSQAWHSVLAGGRYVLGDQVARFEAQLGQTLGGRHVAGVNSGTDALRIALHLLRLQPGDEVILPAYTFFACLEAVVHAGAVPVLCDSREADFLMGASEVEACLSPRTRAVLAVPLFGDASALPGVAALCRQRGLSLVEDAAQAMGAWADEPGQGPRPVGAWGDVSALSFYPTKVLGAVGDAGAVTSPSRSKIEQVLQLRNHGFVHGQHHVIGFNSRLDELQAAALNMGLSCLPGWLQRRAAIARRYLEGMAGLPALCLPHAAPGHAWNYFVLRHPERDHLRQQLAALGVETRVYYPQALHQQPAFAGHLQARRLPVAEGLAATALALPMYPDLRDAQVDRVIEAVVAACRR